MESADPNQPRNSLSSLHITRKFGFCITVSNITPYFLFPTVSLSRGIMIICGMDILISLIVFLLFIIPEIAVLGLDETTGRATIILHVLQFFCIVPAIVGVSGIMWKHICRSVTYMHWKFIEPILLTLMQIIDLAVYGANLKNKHDWLIIFYLSLWVAFLTIVRLLYGIYTSYAMFSFIVILESGREDITHLYLAQGRNIHIELQEKEMPIPQLENQI